MAPPRTLYTYTHFGMYKETRCCRSTFRHKWVTSFPSSSKLPEKHQLAAASTYPAKVISCTSFGEVFIWNKKLRFELVLAVWCSWISYTLFNCLEHGLRMPGKKSPSMHGRKSTPTPKFLGTAEEYFDCHIGPNFQISLIYAFIGCP